MKKWIIIYASLTIQFYSCNQEDQQADASGSFEATETIVSAEGSGKLISFSTTEGSIVKAGEVLGYIDTAQLHFRKEQLIYSIQAILSKRPDAAVQLSTINTQLETAHREKERISRLYKAEAATSKQLDDINAQIDLLKTQYQSLQSSLKITEQSLRSETLPLKSQLAQVKDQIQNCIIKNPVNGTILTLYARQDEVVMPGKALYKVADLSSLILRAYITADQLSLIKLGQKVTVRIDAGKDEFKNYEGTLSWISDQSEFTPKTIQTKEERANLVYAIKVSVKNDGFIKSGMYGELEF